MEPRSDAFALLDETPDAIYTTAARALVVGLALINSPMQGEINADLRAIGFIDVPRSWGGWKERVAFIDESDEILENFDVLGYVRDAEAQEFTEREAGAASKTTASVALWEGIVLTGNPAISIAWLRLLIADRHPLASAAASVSLSRWRRSKDLEVPGPLASARRSLDALSGSADGDAANIAMAALGLEPEVAANEELEAVAEDDGLSLIVHGTWGWSKGWWDNGGDFHTYVLNNVRSNVYSGGRPYSWSGYYRRSHREKAAQRLARWAEGKKLDAIFAHSYGGTIALRATHYGLQVKDLVLLSVPSQAVAAEWRNIDRAVSLRIHLDLVLLAARHPLPFADNVEENYLPPWFVSHSDTHNPSVWQSGGWANRLGLVDT
jgi:hypothetical protein